MKWQQSREQESFVLLSCSWVASDMARLVSQRWALRRDQLQLAYRFCRLFLVSCLPEPELA